MKGIRYIFWLAIILTFSCKDNALINQKVIVNHAGALKTIMSGNLNAVASLDTLLKDKDLYALGAVENLKGEIQIFEGRPSISVVKDRIVAIQGDGTKKASLLVWSRVKNWKTIHIPETIKTKDGLESYIALMADENKINDQPFPFLIEGKVGELYWHVINWDIRDKVHSHEKHKNSGLNGVISNETVEVLGFYSEKHKAIFTHHSTNMHMHFRNPTNTLAGHVDDIHLGSGMILKIPMQ